jgi:Protease, Ulp1 family
VLGQVLEGLFIVFSASLFEKGKCIFVLPSSFFERIDNDLTLEGVIPIGCEDIDFIAGASFYCNHWSLILIDCRKKNIYYLDPLFGYVPKNKILKDVTIVKHIIWYYVLNNEVDTSVPANIEDWDTVYSQDFEQLSLQNLPRQRNGVDCGIFVVMYFFYITSEAKFDFSPGDMLKIREWCYYLLVSNQQVGTDSYISWFVQKLRNDRLGGLKLYQVFLS